MEPMPDTAWDEISHGPRGQPSAIVLLKEHSNEMSPNDILLAQCLAQPPSEKLPPAVGGNSNRDPQLDNVLSERLWNSQSSIGCLTQTSPFKAWGTLWKRRWKDCKSWHGWKTARKQCLSSTVGQVGPWAKSGKRTRASIPSQEAISPDNCLQRKI